jgi:hypothetical protein
MKRILFASAIGALIGATCALAQMDNATYTFNDLVADEDDSSAYVLRGEIEAIYIDMPSTKTATVAVATAEDTVFSKVMTADGVFYPRTQSDSSAGAGLTWLTTGDGSTNAAANVIWGKFVAAGAVTVTVTPDAATSGTNDYTVKVIYKK